MHGLSRCDIRKNHQTDPFHPVTQGGTMWENDPTIEYIDITDELRLIEAIAALAHDLEIEPVSAAG